MNQIEGAYAAIAAGVLVLGGHAQAATPSQAPSSFTSEKVDLPTGADMFPGGEEAQAINSNCLACHSTDMVLNQPRLPKSAWDAEVHKMISTYKAPVQTDAIPSIVDYLTSIKGAK